MHEFSPVYLKRHFLQGVKTKETQELSNPNGGELIIDLDGFTLKVEIKECQNDLAPM